MKPKTKILCPGCGTEFAISDKEKTVMATIVGKDPGPGSVYPAVAGQDAPSSGKTKVPKTAKERIEALRAAGVDVRRGRRAPQGQILHAKSPPVADSLAPNAHARGAPATF